jgi:methylthioribulose-1-phosphate dehydratase
MIQPKDIFVLPYTIPTDPTQSLSLKPFRSLPYIRQPQNLKPSQCTPLFLTAFDKGAGACIHTHSIHAVLVTLLVEQKALAKGQTGKDEHGIGMFEISNQEMIKGIPKGREKKGYLGFFDTLRIPIIENTAHEEDLTTFLTEAINIYPDTYAVLVRRHGIYVWGDTTEKAKTQCEW